RSNATGTHHRWKLATATGNQTVGQVKMSPDRAAVPLLILHDAGEHTQAELFWASRTTVYRELQRRTV
ncbi:hypothetical protein MRU69_15675, partial [Kocuria flava]|nr:hypothetical protein [Kocuria flava]